MTPNQELLAVAVNRIERQVGKNKVPYPRSHHVMVLADLVEEVMKKQSDISRNGLLNKLLENTELSSLALHYDNEMAQMGLTSFIGIDVLAYTLRALDLVSGVLTEEENTQLIPIKKKFYDLNDPKGILALTRTAKLLIPHLIKTVPVGRTSPITQMESGLEQAYDLNYKALVENPKIILDLIALANS